MVNKHISDDLKEAALHLRNDGHDHEYIKRITGISRATIYRIEKQRRLTGSIAKTQAICRGHPRLLVQSNADYLLRLARHKPSMFLNEYTRRLGQFHSLDVSFSTIHRTLIRGGLSIKRVQKLASERSDFACAEYILRIGRYPTDHLICVDEVSKDDRVYAWLWGRAPAGVRVEEHNPFVRKRRLSMVAGMALGEGIIGARVVEGSFMRNTFLEFLRDDIVRVSLPSPSCLM